MRKITIVEVWDPCAKKFIPLKQAVNQGLFNTDTYLFYNPIEAKFYSITEAAQQGLFKSAIDLRPESLIVERIKIAQTVCLISARNPNNFNEIFSIQDAIAQEIVDTNLCIYRNKNEVLELSVAIYRDFVQVETVKEITEKITETLTERKSPDNLGLMKKIETSSRSNLYRHGSMDSINSESSVDNKVQEINGKYIMDLSSSVNVSKRLQKNEQFAAGYISEANSKKILESQNSSFKPILRTSPKNRSNPLIDLSEAIRKDMVFLPDSLVKTQNVKYVVNLKTGERLEFEEACKQGIIDVFNRLYVDTRSNKKINLFEALGKFHIVMKEELYNNYDEFNTSENKRSNSNPTSSSSHIATSTPRLAARQAGNKPFTRKAALDDIETVFNPRTGEQISLNDAIKLGLYDRRSSKYVDFISRRKMSIEEAAEKGMIVLKPDVNSEDYQFLHINGIINPLTKEKMELSEAIESGILDYVECEIHDPETGQTLTLLEAYDKGFLITSVRNHPNSPQELIEAPVAVISTPASPSNSIRNEVLVETNQAQDFKLRKNSQMLSQTLPRQPMKAEHKPTSILKRQESQESEMDKKELVAIVEPSKVEATSSSKLKSQSCNQMSTKTFKSQSQSPMRNSKRDKSFDFSSCKPRGKSEDRASITSRTSILSKFKDKLLGKSRNKVNSSQFDESLIFDSIRILHTISNKQYDLKTAITKEIAIPEDKIRDFKNGSILTIKEAIIQSILRFWLIKEQVEYTYRKNLYIFGDTLYLIKYVLDPEDQKKLSLAEAFDKQILDDENHFYFGKKGPYSFDSAIQKGFIKCGLIDLNSLNNIILSNIFKYSMYSEQDMLNQNKTTSKNDDENIDVGNENRTSADGIDSDEGTLDGTLVKESDNILSSEPDDHVKSSDATENLIETKNITMPTFVASPSLTEANLIAPRAEVMTMDKFQRMSRENSNSKTNSAVVEAEQISETLLPKALKDRLSSKKQIPTVFNAEGFLTPEFLGETGLRYRDNKNYIISHVLDEEKEQYVSLKRAKRIGILNLRTNEFVDPCDGKAIDIITAIQTNKIKISEYRAPSMSSGSRRPSISTEFEETLINEPFQAKTEPIIEIEATTATSSDEPKTKAQEFPESVLNETLTVEAPENLRKGSDFSFNASNDNLEKSPQTLNFDLISVLLYKKPTNGKYIRFDKVIKNKLYDTNTGCIKDLKTHEFVTINEALRREIVRINDSNILFDEENIYKIETVLTGSGQDSLAEALRKKLVDRRACTYKFLGFTYTIKNAMMNGHIEGRIITSSEIKWLIDDYVASFDQHQKHSDELNSEPADQARTDSQQTLKQQQLEAEEEEMFKRLTNSKSSPKYSQSVENLGGSSSTIRKSMNSQNSLNSSTLPSKKSLQDFTGFYIFDYETEMYIPLSDAFIKGIIVDKPIRIIDPNSSSYINLKDAVIKGLLSCEKSHEKVSPKNRSVFYTSNRQSYIIDAVLDAHKTNRCSLQDSTRFGIFKNGMYRNILKGGEYYTIDQAIQMGFIIGKKVDLNQIEDCFNRSLQVPPSKPTRGIFVDKTPSPKSMKGSSSLLNDLNKQTTPESPPARPPNSFGRIEHVKDAKSGRFLSLEDALANKIINFERGFYLNTLTGNSIDISSAVDAGFIVLDYHGQSSVKKNRSRSLSQGSRKTIMPRNTELNDDNIIKVGRQFVITAVLHTVNKVYLDLDDAINVGIFDISSAMYINLLNQKRYTLVDAIDQGYVKIADENFRASYKLIVEEENPFTQRKYIKTYPLRYIVHSITKQIIPINVACDNNLINIENGTYIGYEKILTLKQAYDKHLALTVDDLDRPDSDRAKFKVAMVKKSTTGKNMSVKSALAKNWLNFERRVYIDKQTNQEIPFSQAVDMDLLVLIANLPEKQYSSNNASQLGNSSSNNTIASMSRSDYGSMRKARSSSKHTSRNHQS